MHRRWSTRASAMLIAGAIATADVEARAAAAAPDPSAPTQLFQLDGESGPTGRLQSALHGELRTRELAGAEVASMTELRLAMGCKPGELECLARGGRAMGLGRMIVGALVQAGDGYEVELALVDVAAGEMLQEIRMPLAASALAPDAIDATAKGLVDALFPDSVPPAISTATPMVASASTNPPPPTPKPAGAGRPRWMWIGFGTSLGATTVFAATAIGLTIYLRGGLRNDLLDAVDASHDDANPGNDIDRSSDDLCGDARETPAGEPSARVTNASVTEICNRADAVSKAALAMTGLSVAGLASTIVFSILLAVNPKPKPKRRNVTLVPQLRFDRGASIVLSGRF